MSASSWKRLELGARDAEQHCKDSEKQRRTTG